MNTNQYDFIHVPRTVDNYAFLNLSNFTLNNFIDFTEFYRDVYRFKIKGDILLTYITPYTIEELRKQFGLQNIDILPLECCFYIKQLFINNEINVNGFFYNTRLGQMYFFYDIPYSLIEKIEDKEL